MTIHSETSIHTSFKREGRFSCNTARVENNNAFTLEFADQHIPEFGGVHSVVVFGLIDMDAQILSMVGRLDDAHREALLPILQHMHDEMKAEASA